MIPRTLYRLAWQELASGKPMVLLAGPRQVGKTTLAKVVAGQFVNHVYCS